jgi:hypothetical protein
LETNDETIQSEYFDKTLDILDNAMYVEFNLFII